MKHNKVIAALAVAGGMFAANAAYAFAPAVAIGLAALAGAGIGHEEAKKAHEPPVAMVPSTETTVIMGGPPAQVEVIPAPRDGFQWSAGHYELRNGVSTWVPGHWVANDTVIIQHD